MTGFASSLSTIWRLAIPYFRSEDRWAGRLLLSALIATELSLVGITVLLNQWYNTFYNSLQERNWDVFITQLPVLLSARGGCDGASGLPALSQPMAADLAGAVG